MLFHEQELIIWIQTYREFMSTNLILILLKIIFWSNAEEYNPRVKIFKPVLRVGWKSFISITENSLKFQDRLSTLHSYKRRLGRSAESSTKVSSENFPCLEKISAQIAASERRKKKYLQNITKSKSATARFIINIFVVDLISGLAATTVKMRK